MTLLLQRASRWTAIVLASGAAATVLATAAAPAQAQSGTAALCTVSFPVITITPPFAPFVLTPATGTVSSEGPTGTVTCIGTIDGDRVTGPGTADVKYTYSNGTCVAHVGLGTASWVIPTDAGPKHMTGVLSVRRTGVSVLADDRFPQARIEFAGALVPIEGDCVLSPLRKVSVSLAGALLGTT